jgi:hypothetical protein
MAKNRHRKRAAALRQELAELRIPAVLAVPLAVVYAAGARV